MIESVAKMLFIQIIQKKIFDAILKQKKKGKYRSEKIYGNGHAGRNIAKILNKIKVNIQKKNNILNFMNILAIIPARGNSKSIKNKNLIKINGKSLIDYTIESSKKSKNLVESLSVQSQKKF